MHCITEPDWTAQKLKINVANHRTPQEKHPSVLPSLLTENACFYLRTTYLATAVLCLSNDERTSVQLCPSMNSRLTEGQMEERHARCPLPRGKTHLRAHHLCRGCACDILFNLTSAMAGALAIRSSGDSLTAQ